MRFKATKDQLEGMVRLLEYLLAQYPAENVAEELLEELVNKTYMKLLNKSRQLYCNNNSWSFTLSSLEAKALYLFYQNTYIDDTAFPYEANFLQNIYKQIDQQYGRTKPRNQENRGLATGSPNHRLDS
ncbi:hypothetical protein H7F33_05625 [Pedobacter sp. PAMC26386]|nr:hypothetical protein H7F33_05625 [Pedobacter sp. PAMC26386]